MMHMFGNKDAVPVSSVYFQWHVIHADLMHEHRFYLPTVLGNRGQIQGGLGD